MSAHRASVRVADLALALSLATDLGTGQPMECELRACWYSMRAAETLGLDDDAKRCVFHVALLRFLGCTSDAGDTAVLAGGDDLRFNSVMGPMLNASPGQRMRFFLHHLADDLPPRQRLGRVAAAVADPSGGDVSLAQHCEVAERLATRIGLPHDVCRSLAHAYERWDGKGSPARLSGADVPMAVRVVTVARDAELWATGRGWPATAEMLRARRGHAYDPAVVDAFLEGGEAWRGSIGDDPCAAVLAAEPDPPVTLPADHLDTALEAVADFTDLKSAWTRGHSTGVAALAGDAALAAGLSADEATTLRRAGLVHDVGRVGVPNGIWDRPGPLTAVQWERVRLHPYLTERVLSHCALLRPLAEVAGAHHERADGTGYHRGLTGGRMSLAGSLLAAADAYHAMTEPRPHRPALTPAQAAAQLTDEVDAGRFTRVEVDAVLAAAGQAGRPPNVARPAGLTEREVDVLRLIARGRSNKQVAGELGISRKTVGHHVEHIYSKAGVGTRAGATLFAMESGLLRRSGG
jgi:HD-GYP domain-containing protein (c-di-GMP phosphodiesterase class II)